MNVLVIAAHPDDEVLGCGATMARLADEGHQVHISILGEGATSRTPRREDTDPRAVGLLQAHAAQAAKIVGAHPPVLHGLPDNRFDTLPLLDLVKAVESDVARVGPEQVYTHSGGDLNIDHALTHRAVLTATRPLPGSPVRAVFAFEVPSSTEWAFQTLQPAFRPNVFVDASATLARKVRALQAYEGEVRDFPHPRSPEALRATAQRWGSVAGLTAAEAFELVREVRPAGGR